jgi:hypothetical protein
LPTEIDVFDLLTSCGGDPDSISLQFQRCVILKLADLSDERLCMLAGMLLTCGGVAEERYIADFAFRRITDAPDPPIDTATC